MAANYDRGLDGEQTAAGYLEQKGFEILAHRWRSGRKEIDLVARRGELVVFVEVKSRGSERFAPIETSVTENKRKNLVEAAAGWLAQHGPGESERQYRFDVILVLGSDNDDTVSVEHIEDAFRA
ncbi:MAG: YraN family protein [Candidatus Glassbacteria bacterium]|nr:YraN family protein [Candidatus Glassbacteria bacterium]